MTEGGRYRGRPVSWVAVVIIMAGFTLGGIGLIVDRWWLFWVAVGVVVVGGILAVAVDIFADVELDHLHPHEDEDGPARQEITGSGAAESESPAAASPAKDPAGA